MDYGVAYVLMAYQLGTRADRDPETELMANVLEGISLTDSGPPRFIARHLNVLRWRVKSPGQV